jgi:hypothetical protein
VTADEEARGDVLARREPGPALLAGHAGHGPFGPARETLEIVRATLDVRPELPTGPKQRPPGGLREPDPEIGQKPVQLRGRPELSVGREFGVDDRRRDQLAVPVGGPERRLARVSELVVGACFRMVYPASVSSKSTSSPGSIPGASRISFGMVTWPLLVTRGILVPPVVSNTDRVLQWFEERAHEFSRGMNPTLP